MLAVKALGETGGELVQRVCRLGEVWVGLPIRIATAPLVHGQGVGEDNVLLYFSPAHADAGMTALAPAHIF